MTSTTNNKRLLKNTIYLYLRMLVVMAIGLYTVRAFLDILGVVDYGIYNVVGGVVSMFAFLNRTLATSSQRYFSIALAKGDEDRLNKWFCLNITTFMLIGFGIVLVLETIGLWFLNTQMTIPEDRYFAANVVYQLSIIAFIFQIFSIPYLALIIAHEKMNFFAFVGIFEAVGKLLIVFILRLLLCDKLILYGLLILLLNISVAMSYVIFCGKKYNESRYKWYWDKEEAKELLGFSGWHFMGTISGAIKSQGINILLNMFFNPAINAARAIAFQVNSHITQLSSNFYTALKPQIYKTYASEEYDELYKLLMRGTIICAFLISAVAFPVLSCTDFILDLWLKEVPDYAVLFTRLALIDGLIESTQNTLWVAALATGKIKKFMMVISSVVFCNLPISYVALKLGCEPTVTFYVSILITLTVVIVMSYMLIKMINFPFNKYMVLLLKIAVISIVLFLIIHFSISGWINSFKTLVFSGLVIESFLSLSYMLIVSKSDRTAIINIVVQKIRKK